MCKERIQSQEIMLKNFFIFILFTFSILSNGQEILSYALPTDSVYIHYDSITHISYELPEITKGETVVTHFAYCLSYNEEHEQANWVAYELNAGELLGQVERGNKFIQDPLITTGSAANEDYLKSGYDRGHLAPAADMKWTEIAMKESFYYSNMSPQNPSFNRGIWKNLEEQVRDWTNEYQRVYIVTGPILREGLPTLGPNKVTIPEYYYKAILTFTNNEAKVIALVLPNKPSKDSLSKFTISIDSLETLSHINFFPALPDEVENKIESQNKYEDWSWTILKKKVEKSDSGNKSTAQQCKGITKEGKQCARKTTSESGFCYQHEE